MAPEILVFFGLIASGKSTLAGLLAREKGWAWFNTDRVRKELAGISPTERRPEDHGQGIYSPEMTARTYQALLERAAPIVAAGGSVILDGSYSRKTDRDQVRAWGRDNGAEVRFVLCFCSEPETRRRLEKRARDPLAVSDGRWEIFVRQRRSFEEPHELGADELLVLDTGDTPERLLTAVEKWLAGTDH